MNAIPTFRDLDALGTDAGPYLDACIAEIEQAIPLARNKTDCDGLKDDLHRLNRLHRAYFGEVQK